MKSKTLNPQKVINNSSQIIAIALLLTMLYACNENFLNVEPAAKANEALLANEKGVDVLLTGAYAALDGYTINGSAARAGSVTNWVFNCASDDATKGSDFSDQAPINVIENYTVDANNVYLNNKWRCNYEGINRANMVLKVLAKCDPALPQETQTSITAQVAFLRAFFHFELKRVFNNIPYITEDVDPLTVPNTIDVWPLIEADLEYAADNLPENQIQVGRPTKYAAEAVLARVYMFQKKWDQAKILLDDIISSNKYSLMDKFSDNSTAANRNNKESIFEIQYSVNDGASSSVNGGGADGLTWPYNIEGSGTCCGFHQPTQNLVNAYQVDAEGLPILSGTVPNLKNDMYLLSTDPFVQDTVALVDPRLDLTVGRRGVPYLDWGIMRGKDWIRDQSNGGPYIFRKHFFMKKNKGTGSDASGQGTNTNNYRAYRYAHILLWRAEVAVESSTPDFAYAATLVNMIRSRASNEVVMGRCRTFVLGNQAGLNVDYTIPAANYLVNPYPSDFPNLEYARKAIRTEMRLEFAQEGYRFYDLVRWGIAEPTLNAFLEQDRGIRSLYGGSVPAVFKLNLNEYFPIPQAQIDLQPDILTQNPGY